MTSFERCYFCKGKKSFDLCSAWSDRVTPICKKCMEIEHSLEKIYLHNF